MKSEKEIIADYRNKQGKEISKGFELLVNILFNMMFMVGSFFLVFLFSAITYQFIMDGESLKIPIIMLVFSCMLASIFSYLYYKTFDKIPKRRN